MNAGGRKGFRETQRYNKTVRLICCDACIGSLRRPGQGGSRE
jgi:hypothetical protein